MCPGPVRQILPIEEIVVFGKGVRIAPVTSCEASRVTVEDSPEELIVSFLSRSNPQTATITPKFRDADLRLSGGALSLNGLAVLDTVDVSNEWRIGAPLRGYSVIWPRGFKLCSTRRGSASPFELHSSDGSMFDIRGPWTGAAAVPTPPQLIGPGQRVIEQGVTRSSYWVELEYQHEGRNWRQTHTYGILGPETVVLVTAQYLAEFATRKRQRAISLANSVAPLNRA